MTITSKEIKERALELGFVRVGIAPAEPLEAEGALLREWLSLGYHGKMGYMERGADRRSDPKLLLPSVRSIISLAFNYYTPHKREESADRGKISRYAWGDDYHDVLGDKQQQLIGWIKEREPEAEAKSYVDAGPMMDKAWAVRAGIGWLGKHTNVITRQYGSWIFLGEILLSIELECDEDASPDFCGTCTRCIDACPTNAIVEPYLVDSRLCISYGTIELKDAELPEPIGSNLKNWIFGCDICQDVCPWNRFEKETDEERFQPRPENVSPRLEDLEKLSEEEFKSRFKGSPITRPKHAGFVRNVKAAKNDERRTTNDERE